MSDVEIGDKLFDERGVICKVMAKSPVLKDRECYRICFDDNTEIIADANHEWLVFNLADRTALMRLTPEFRAKRRKIRRSRSKGKRPDVVSSNKNRVWELKTLPEGLVLKTSQLSPNVKLGIRTNYVVPVTMPLQLPHKKLLLDPYILGLWLGDGTSRGGSFTTTDEEIVNAFEWAGFRPHKRSGLYDYGTYGLSPILRRLGVLNNKHIPSDYLRAAASQRLALLMGLMDTDGSCAIDGGAEFTSTKKTLADGVYELAASLGLKPSLIEGVAKLNGKKVGAVWDVHFTTRHTVFRLTRKSKRQNQKERGVQQWRYITNIESVESCPVQCITVSSPSGLYLAGKAMIPTHNSDALLMAALQYVDTPGYAALLLRRTFKALTLPEALLDRARMWFTGQGVRWQSESNTFIFPSGAKLVFGYLEADKDVEQYQSAAFQFCVTRGTPILMADGSWKPIEDIEIGDYVQTLEGGHQVQQVYELGRKPVARIRSSLGEVVVGAQHRLLTVFDGWSSPMELLSKQYLPFGSNGGCSLPKYAISSLHHECLYSGRKQAPSPFQQNNGGTAGLDFAFLARDGQNDCVKSECQYLEVQPQHKQGVPLVLCGQSPRLKELPVSWYEADGVFPLAGQLDFPIGYRKGLHSYDVPAQMVKVTDLESTPQLAYAVRQNRIYQHLGGQGNTLGYNHLEYVHPYTMEHRPILGDVLCLPCDISLEGEADVLDLTVSSCSHYIIYPGIVSSNCGFDELTQFTEYQYRYMHSRTRRLEGSNVPIKIRGASNPGSIGHEWVKQRFIVEGKEYNRPFIPATLNDNPHLDRVSYIKSLSNLDPVTRLQLLNGDWSARRAGGKFRREWFEIVETAPIDCRKVRFWDMAATEPKKGKDPDYTAGCLMGISSNQTLYIIDMKRLRGTPSANENLVKQTAELDGKHIPVRMEQEPGSSGVKAIDDYRRRVLMGWDFKGIPSTGSKEVRANPVASQAEAGNVKLVRGIWINDFLDEAEAFPGGVHDDMVDSVSGAFGQLIEQPEPQENIVVYDAMKLVDIKI